MPAWGWGRATHERRNRPCHHHAVTRCGRRRSVRSASNGKRRSGPVRVRLSSRWQFSRRPRPGPNRPQSTPNPPASWPFIPWPWSTAVKLICEAVTRRRRLRWPGARPNSLWTTVKMHVTRARCGCWVKCRLICRTCTSRQPRAIIANPCTRPQTSACSRSLRTATRPRQALPPHGQARAGPGAFRHRDDDVPRDGMTYWLAKAKGEVRT